MLQFEACCPASSSQISDSDSVQVNPERHVRTGLRREVRPTGRPAVPRGSPTVAVVDGRARRGALGRGLLRAAAAAAILAGVQAPAAEHCVVLQYHHVGHDTPGSTSVTPAQFQAHLDYLREGAYAVLPLEAVVGALRAKSALPERCVSLSLDDAYVSVYQEVFPRLRELGWPFTVFVATAGLDAGEEAYVNWDQLREMARAGGRVENHSHSHAHLIRQEEGETPPGWRARVRRDIETAQMRIEQETGRRPVLFAYPYGEYDDALRDIVRELGLNGLGQQSGPAWNGDDFTALPRFPMAGSYAELPQFKTKVDSLPLPIESVLPADPVVAPGDWKPRLRLRLTRGSLDMEGLRCYLNGRPVVELTPVPGDPDAVDVVALDSLSVGRNRYNCTMPSMVPERWYWYSHLWIRRRADGGWYSE